MQFTLFAHWRMACKHSHTHSIHSQCQAQDNLIRRNVHLQWAHIHRTNGLEILRILENKWKPMSGMWTGWPTGIKNSVRNGTDKQTRKDYNEKRRESNERNVNTLRKCIKWLPRRRKRKIEKEQKRPMDRHMWNEYCFGHSSTECQSSFLIRPKCIQQFLTVVTRTR